MDKHSTYFTVLDALKTAKECPLCYLEADAMHAYFDAILYEAVNDPKVRSELVRSKGYCHRHAHYLVEMRDSFGIAIMYQDQLKLFQESLSKKTLAGSERNSERSEKHAICPACENQLETRRRYLEVLTEGLAEPEIKAAYEGSPGLCAPHLAMMLEAVKNSELQDYLYNIEQQKLNSLWDELQEFIRKHDYRYSHEPYGTEGDSWHRAIKKLTGSKEIFD